ncbi:MAG: hypothetical protein COU72_03865, partial [Parcubacteria group bacterium CG10_big_fil_rev_8_21_14_0_10_41_35]
MVALNPKDVKIINVYSDKEGSLETFRRGYDKAFSNSATVNNSISQTESKTPKIVEKLSTQEKTAAKASEIKDKYRRPEEIELEQAERAPDPKEVSNEPIFQERRSGNVIAPDTQRADELVSAPPGTPPRPPQETSIGSDDLPPDGSALRQIDAMVGKLSPAANLLDKAKKAIEVF